LGKFGHRMRVLEQEVAVLRAAIAARKPDEKPLKRAFPSIAPVDKNEVEDLRHALKFAGQLVDAHLEGKATDPEHAAVVLGTHLRRAVEIGRQAFLQLDEVQRAEVQTTVDWFDTLYVWMTK
jgi:hypothetical protein